ncbi:hypothetical protein [Streptomyces sp. NPDC004284]|uniref:hypothetical protein n=1 Tax=Streptomyces sp. NPDC004284 TaxID=3364695 RepID=UPI00367D765B
MTAPGTAVIGGIGTRMDIHQAAVIDSAGRTNRHRINGGGDRYANSVLCSIVLVRMQYDRRTPDYVVRRTAEEVSTRDIMRYLKRFVAREVRRHLTSAGTVSTAGSAGARS